MYRENGTKVSGFHHLYREPGTHVPESRNCYRSGKAISLDLETTKAHQMASLCGISSGGSRSDPWRC